MKKLFQKSKMSLGMDETTDADSWFITHIIVGKLSTEPSKPFLLCCKELINATTKLFINYLIMQFCGQMYNV